MNIDIHILNITYWQLLLKDKRRALIIKLGSKQPNFVIP